MIAKVLLDESGEEVSTGEFAGNHSDGETEESERWDQEDSDGKAHEAVEQSGYAIFFERLEGHAHLVCEDDECC